MGRIKDRVVELTERWHHQSTRNKAAEIVVVLTVSGILIRAGTIFIRAKVRMDKKPKDTTAAKTILSAWPLTTELQVGDHLSTLPESDTPVRNPDGSEGWQFQTEGTVPDTSRDPRGRARRLAASILDALGQRVLTVLDREDQ